MFICGNTTGTLNFSIHQFENFSDEFLSRYIGNEQYHRNLTNIPLVVFYALLFIVGVVGNPLVIFVYTHHRKRTATQYLIVCIAVVDMVTTLVGVPLRCYVSFISLQIDNVYICKLNFSNFCNEVMSVFLLVFVAYVRFRKICRPFSWQVSTKHVRTTIVILAVLSIGLTSLHLTIHGRQEKETSIPGLCTYQCRVDQSYVSTPWPKVVIGLFILVFLICCWIMCCLYFQISRQVSHQAKKRVMSKNKRKLNSEKGFLPKTDNRRVLLKVSYDVILDELKTSALWQENEIFEDAQNCEKAGEKKISDHKEKNQGQTLLNAHQTLTSFNHEIENTQLQRCEKVKQKTLKPKRRTNAMLLAITVVYIVTNMTTLILMLIRSTADHLLLSLPPVWASLYYLLLSLSQLNSAVNPIVYSMCDKNFRENCRAVFRRMDMKRL
ncbi:hypothetical protein Btru_050652 [Bulinus truncatus]|nr:hypothetical protein Btru_050652 [Bulinus truncatus]